MATLSFKPDPDNSWHRVIIFTLLYVLVILMVISCKTKELVTEKEYVYITDSTYINQRDSIINTLEHKYASQKEYTTVIENMLANTVKGTAGAKKKNPLIPKTIQDLTLSAGKDTIELTGVWDWIDYEWYKAPTSNIFKERLDSVSKEIKSKELYYKSLISEKDSIYSKIIASKTDTTKYRTNYRYLILSFIIGFASCFTIFKWSTVSGALKWVAKLF